MVGFFFLFFVLFFYYYFFIFTGEKSIYNLLLGNQIIYVVHNQVRHLNGLGFSPLTLAHFLETASLSSVKERFC